MPNPETNPEAPSQAYGEKVQRDTFVEQTTPEPAAGGQGGGQEPNFYQPPPERIPPPDEVLVEGNPLLPEEFGAMSRAVSPDVEGLGAWAPVLRQVADLPGAPNILRHLADQVDRRYAE